MIRSRLLSFEPEIKNKTVCGPADCIRINCVVSGYIRTWLDQTHID